MTWIFIWLEYEVTMFIVSQSDGELSPDEMGRVTYEQSGETFFLPFTLEDIENGERIKAGDHVEFFISTDERWFNISCMASCMFCSLSLQFTEIDHDLVICESEFYRVRKDLLD